MHKYIVRRLFIAIPTLLGAVTLIFVIMRVLPGDVAFVILASEEGGAFNKESYLQLREQLGLDRPIYVQYFEWLGGLLRFNLGESLITGEDVAGELIHRLGLTLQICLMATVIGLVLGVPLGIFAAYRQDTIYDYGLRAVAAVGLAVPAFWVGLLILLLGLRWFMWSPPVGYHPIWQGIGDNMKQLIWPAVVIGLHPVSTNSRMTRSTMLEVLREDYIRTARAKGLGETVILIRHALRNAFIPVLTLASVSFLMSVSGSIIMEQIFTIPGVGLMLIEGVRLRDYPVVIGVIAFVVTAMIVINLLVDVSYAWLDPRIRYQ